MNNSIKSKIRARIPDNIIANNSESYKELKFIESKGDNPKLKFNHDMFLMSYYLTSEGIQFNNAFFDKFVKKTKALIRNSDLYKEYIAYIRDTVCYKQDAFFANLTQDKVKLEMHHGPIFNLHDLVLIIIEYLFDMGKPVSSSYVADLVLEEHVKNRVSVCMLTEDNHIRVHENKLILSPSQCFGDVENFKAKYWKYINNPIYIKKIKDYEHLLRMEAERINKETLARIII
jgi:hypothetical protein